MQQLKVNTSLQGGQYWIEKVLGQGSFGITYRGYDTLGEMRVAIKEFFMKGVTERDDDDNSVNVSDISNYATFREQKEKFRKEAKRLAKLKNLHIVCVYNQFDENGTVYYVMDYVDGENLRERINRTGKPLTEDEVWEILPQVLDALKAVHKEGLWHLDLKPGNIMVDNLDNVKLIDFGASKQIDPQRGGATAHTTVCYTVGYAPREQMDQRYNAFGPWTDIYALGATLYALLTNKRPPLPSDIDEDGSYDKRNAIALPAGTSDKMRNLIVWMMQTNRKRRPQSVDMLLAKINPDAAEETKYEQAEKERSETTEETEFSQGSSAGYYQEKGNEETEFLQGYSQQYREVNNQQHHKVNNQQYKEAKTSSVTMENQNSDSDFGIVMLVLILILGLVAAAVIIKNTNQTYTYTEESMNTSQENVQKQEFTYGKKDVWFSSTGDGIYEGDLKNGEMHGHGTITYSSGMRFTGDFRNDQPNGHGMLTNASGKIIFDGEYKDGARVSGKQTYDDGSTFDGTYMYGVRYDGTLRDVSGEILFKGTFSTYEGSYDTGYGKEKGDNGEYKFTYVGDFKDGHWHGKGTITWEDGDKYVGDFKEGDRTGYGKYSWSDGDFYEGNFLNNNKHGSGTYYYADGTYVKGVWKNDERISVTEEGTWH